MKIVLSTVLVTLIVLASSSNIFATTELAYDDGTAWTGLSGAAQVQFAVRFSLQPGWSSAKILTARYFIWDRPSAFKIHIYGSDGFTELLTPPLTVNPTGTGWFDVDLSSYNIVVSGDFYISIELESGWEPAIGMDDTTPIDLRSYAKPPSSLWELLESSDLMIRAVVDPIAAAAVGGVVVSTNKLEILTPYLALAGLATAVLSAVVVVRKKRD